jgi:hypothetical protein
MTPAAVKEAPIMSPDPDRRADFQALRLLIDTFDEGSVRTPEERAKLARRALRLIREAAWHAARAARIVSLLIGSKPGFSAQAADSESPLSEGGEEVAK